MSVYCTFISFTFFSIVLCFIQRLMRMLFANRLHVRGMYSKYGLRKEAICLTLNVLNTTHWQTPKAEEFLQYTDKKESKIFLKYKEIKRDRVQSHIWLTVSSYMGKNLRISSYITNIWGNAQIFPLGSPSSNMTLHPIPSEFPYIWGIFCFLFYQCIS